MGGLGSNAYRLFQFFFPLDVEHVFPQTLGSTVLLKTKVFLPSAFAFFSFRSYFR